MYGLEASFFLKLILLIAIIILVFVLFDIFMRKLLKVEKKKFFSYNHVNEKHKKIEWMIRITFVVILFGFYIYSMSDPVGGFLYLQFVPIAMLIFILVTETLRAFMEWKYAANKKAYIVTVSQLVFASILVISMFTTDFFGWFG
ncbi:DUF4181 domain-containing protein [Cytobacillus sp. FJAT-53684]|uniref:DUF4181 domain-containing protein n=1 Tax=Cytobacillus mangrovibacter TaxID=3299024 RepID=A0ABW6K0D6_9BACI